MPDIFRDTFLGFVRVPWWTGPLPAQIDGREAFYVLGSDVYGPMGKELIPFEKETEARGFLKDHGGRSILRYREVTPAVLKLLD